MSALISLIKPLFSAFTRKGISATSVEDILKSFNAVVAELDAHQYKHEEHIAKQEEAIAAAIAEKAQSEAEIAAAKAAAEGIRALLGK